jgi:hypothetical protein
MRSNPARVRINPEVLLATNYFKIFKRHLRQGECGNGDSLGTLEVTCEQRG